MDEDSGSESERGSDSDDGDDASKALGRGRAGPSSPPRSSLASEIGRYPSRRRQQVSLFSPVDKAETSRSSRQGDRRRSGRHRRDRGGHKRGEYHDDIDDSEDEVNDDANSYSSARGRRRSARLRGKGPSAEGDHDNGDDDVDANVAVRRSGRKRREVKPLYADYLREPKRKRGSDKKDRARRDTYRGDGGAREDVRRRRRRREAQCYGQEEEQSDLSDATSDSTEAEFEKREARRLHRERAKIRPINADMHELTAVRLDQPQKRRRGAPKADIEPAQIDTNIDWASVGGLDGHVCALKEMVALPLLYPSLFLHFGITPPRGVIFHGPPGTGKTLVARALASTCSRHGKKVSFFMRKGADCLSKWVGEAERQLRLLFEQAQRLQPSIIFFDEIDGLAPVRSSRQDQIHSSIVSTLLALMDGLDSRGQVIVIGATNRIDAIDPALRRPGRFDRELRFGLPDQPARRQILGIHTRKWDPAPAPELLDSLSKKCLGYCGADLKALCTEASLAALRRCYPQVYTSDARLKIDVQRIQICGRDFDQAMTKIVAASRRSRATPVRALPRHLEPLLLEPMRGALAPFAAVGGDAKAVQQKSVLLFHGEPNMGQAYVGPALLHGLESLPVHSIDLPTLLSDASSRCAEEALTRAFTECCRTAPSVLYWPHADLWWDTASEVMRNTLQMLFQDIPSASPVALVAYTDTPLEGLPAELRALFEGNGAAALCCALAPPTNAQRKAFFEQLKSDAICEPSLGANQAPAELPLAEAEAEPDNDDNGADAKKENQGRAQDAKSRVQAASAGAEQSEREMVQCKLRMFLRSVVDRLIKYFKDFVELVDEERDGAPNYYRIILQPICLLDMRDKINSGEYMTMSHFLTDVDLLVSNAKEYNYPDNYVGRGIINKACHLQDSAFAMACQFPKALADKCKQFYDIKLQSEQRAAERIAARSNGKAEPSAEPIATRTKATEDTKADASAAGAQDGEEEDQQNGAQETKSADDASPEVEAVNGGNDAKGSAGESASDLAKNAEAGECDNGSAAPPNGDAGVEKPANELKLDRAGLEKFLACTAVKRTARCSLRDLETAFLKVQGVIEKYQDLWDRSDLVRNLEALDL